MTSLCNNIVDKGNQPLYIFVIPLPPTHHQDLFILNDVKIKSFKYRNSIFKRPLFYFYQLISFLI